jgi:hypothetical protein
VLLAKYNWIDEVKEDEMGRHATCERDEKSEYRVLVGEHKGNRLLGRLRSE